MFVFGFFVFFLEGGRRRRGEGEVKGRGGERRGGERGLRCVEVGCGVWCDVV